MKREVEVIMEFAQDGTSKVVTVKNLPDLKKCRAVAEQFAEINGEVDQSSIKMTQDAYATNTQTAQNKLKH